MALFTALGGGVDVKGGIVFGKKLSLGEHSVSAPIYANAAGRIEKDAAAVIGDTGSWLAWRNMVAEGKTLVGLPGIGKDMAGHIRETIGQTPPCPGGIGLPG